MIDYNENMGAGKRDIDYLNALVNNINEHLSRECFEIESTEGYESECVDIFEDGLISCTYMGFEEAETYLQGIETGVILAKGLGDDAKAKQRYE